MNWPARVGRLEAAIICAIIDLRIAGRMESCAPSLISGAIDGLQRALNEKAPPVEAGLSCPEGISCHGEFFGEAPPFISED